MGGLEMLTQLPSMDRRCEEGVSFVLLLFYKRHLPFKRVHTINILQVVLGAENKFAFHTQHTHPHALTRTLGISRLREATTTHMLCTQVHLFTPIYIYMGEEIWVSPACRPPQT